MPDPDKAPLPKEVKVVLFGEARIGKSCLVKAYGGDKYMPKYNPTELDGFGAQVEYEGKEITIQMVDTSGRKELKPVRMLGGGDGDCAILCFNLDDDKSLERALGYWLDEIETLVPGIPVVLCGTKADLRDISLAKG